MPRQKLCNAPKPGEKNPVEGKCSLYLARKGRFCVFDVAKGSERCGHHAETRTVCSLCSSHVAADKLDAHVNVCPVRVRLAWLRCQPYFSEDVNVTGNEDARGAPASDGGIGDPDDPKGLVENGVAKAQPLDDAALLAAVHRAFETLDGSDIVTAVPAAREYTCLAPLEGEGAHARKHRLQHVGLVAALEDLGCLTDAGEVVFVELGAGKGGLSRAVAARADELRSSEPTISTYHKSAHGKTHNDNDQDDEVHF